MLTNAILRHVAVIVKMVALRIRNKGGIFPGYGNWGHFTTAV
jgi:hypothetical protein